MKFTGAVPAQNATHLHLPPSRRSHPRPLKHIPAYVASCQVTLSMMVGAGGVERKQRRSLSPCVHFSTYVFFWYGLPYYGLWFLQEEAMERS